MAHEFGVIAESPCVVRALTGDQAMGEHLVTLGRKTGQEAVVNDETRDGSVRSSPVRIWGLAGDSDQGDCHESICGQGL